MARMKVPGGKLLVIKEKAGKYRIQGDFFLYPEHKLQLLEEALNSTPLKDLKEKLETIVDVNDIQMVGITVDAICQLMEEFK